MEGRVEGKGGYYWVGNLSNLSPPLLSLCHATACRPLFQTPHCCQPSAATPFTGGKHDAHRGHTCTELDVPARGMGWSALGGAARRRRACNTCIEGSDAGGFRGCALRDAAPGAQLPSPRQVVRRQRSAWRRRRRPPAGGEAGQPPGPRVNGDPGRSLPPGEFAGAIQARPPAWRDREAATLAWAGSRVAPASQPLCPVLPPLQQFIFAPLPAARAARASGALWPRSHALV